MVNRLQCEVFRTHGFAPCRIPADRIEQTVVSESTTSWLYFRKGRQELRPRRSFDTSSLFSPIPLGSHRFGLPQRDRNSPFDSYVARRYLLPSQLERVITLYSRAEDGVFMAGMSQRTSLP